MKVLKKAAVFMFAFVLSIGIFQLSALATPAGTTVINGFGILFDLPHDGDREYPEVEVDLTEGIDDVSISFLTKEKEKIDPADMIEGEEYFASIQVHADVANGYEFENEANEPCLTLSVNGDSTSPISGGMPAEMQDGYFVSDPAASAPYNNITILKKFTAQGRIKWTYTSQLTVEGEKNIKVGETLIINISEIDENRDAITEYTWKITDEKGEQRISRQDTGTFSFTPDKPGTYSITLSHLKLHDSINLEPSEDNSVVITVVTEEPSTGDEPNVPKTGDEFNMIFWIAVFALSISGFFTIVLKRKTY